MRKECLPRIVAAAVFVLACPILPALELASPFSDHMVLQQQMAVPIWGWAEPGEEITVTFSSQTKTTHAGADRRWEVTLDSLPASTVPGTLVVTASRSAKSVRVDDVLVGEVWLCGGQSNMERLLGATNGQPITGAREAIAQAEFPHIRQLMVNRGFSLTPKATVDATWTVCSPDTAGRFSAVGFFFARELLHAKNVPVGIINCSYGGSAAEAWMSQDATKVYPDLSARLEIARAEPADPIQSDAFFLRNLRRWFETYDPGTKAGWQRPDLPVDSWGTMSLPGIWEYAGHPAVDGVTWFRKRFEVRSEWIGRELELHLGVIDDGDTTWLNGTEVGTTFRYGEDRTYCLPAALLVPGENVIAVRVLDFANDGGFLEPASGLRIGLRGQPESTVSLDGPWSYRISLPSIEAVPIPPQESSRFGIWVPGNLYNAMLAPLAPYALRGFTFYQGETNTGHAIEYQTLFPALIANWRETWREGDIPFLFVQLAPFRSSRPELCEAQAISWRRTRNTAMVVTSDCTDANDIHPPDKATVGRRLTLSARALAYGEPVEYSGPCYRALSIDGARAILSFDHVGGGLVAKDGPLRDFAMAGQDGVFRPAKAEIVGDSVVVTSSEIRQPAAVRYGWKNVPDGNLYNRAGLPASSFRTDPPTRSAAGTDAFDRVMRP